MLIIGVTGGIGSGKTAATDAFSDLGIDIIDADTSARTVVKKGQPALLKIAEKFGSEILLETGELDRAALRKVVFSDPKHRQWLEALTHPLIREDIVKGLTNATSPYVILSSPLLIESSQFKLAHRILVIDVSEETQLKRTIKRDSNDEKQVQAIINAQISRSKRLEYADDIISNESDLNNLQQQVKVLHETYLEMSKQ